MMNSGRSMLLFFSLSLLVALLLQLVLLPDFLSAARPFWVPLVIAYWALIEPRAPILISAFFVGIAMDVVFNTVLGQHALGLVILAYLVTRLRPIFILFPLWQSTLALIPGWAVYTALMYWIDNKTQHQADLWLRWLPLISSTLFWPFVFVLMEWIRTRDSRD